MSETTTTYKVGDRVRVSAEADDVYFGGEVEGVVVENDPPEYMGEAYVAEGRVNVQAPDLDWNGALLTQYVRPEDLTLITDEN